MHNMGMRDENKKKGNSKYKNYDFLTPNIIGHFRCIQTMKTLAIIGDEKPVTDVCMRERKMDK